MSEEEKEAIEDLKVYMESPISCDNCRYCSGKRTTQHSLKILLNLIEKKQKEIELKDKVIDKMVYELSSIWRYNLYQQINPKNDIYKLIKEHFYKEVEK